MLSGKQAKKQREKESSQSDARVRPRADPFHQRADTQAARNRRDAPALDTPRCERTNEIPEGRVGGR